MYRYAYSGFTYNELNLETTQKPNREWINKLWFIHAMNIPLLNVTRYGHTQTHRNILKTSHWTKETRPKRVHSLQFSLFEVYEETRLNCRIIKWLVSAYSWEENGLGKDARELFMVMLMLYNFTGVLGVLERKNNFFSTLLCSWPRPL